MAVCGRARVTASEQRWLVNCWVWSPAAADPICTSARLRRGPSACLALDAGPGPTAPSGAGRWCRVTVGVRVSLLAVRPRARTRPPCRRRKGRDGGVWLPVSWRALPAWVGFLGGPRFPARHAVRIRRLDLPGGARGAVGRRDLRGDAHPGGHGLAGTVPQIGGHDADRLDGLSGRGAWCAAGSARRCGCRWTGRGRGATISLKVIRRLASRRGRRIGSLFFNPGGPGVSGVGIVSDPQEGAQPDRVAGGRFDIVSWDPRGTNASTPVRCFRSDALLAKFWGPEPFPTTTRSPVAGLPGQDGRLRAAMPPAERPAARAHLHCRHGPRSRPSAPARRRPAAHLLRLVLRDLPRTDLRQPVPGAGVREGARRRARPSRHGGVDGGAGCQRRLLHRPGVRQVPVGMRTRRSGPLQARWPRRLARRASERPTPPAAAGADPGPHREARRRVDLRRCPVRPLRGDQRPGRVAGACRQPRRGRGRRWIGPRDPGASVRQRVPALGAGALAGRPLRRHPGPARPAGVAVRHRPAGTPPRPSPTPAASPHCSTTRSCSPTTDTATPAPWTRAPASNTRSAPTSSTSSTSTPRDAGPSAPRTGSRSTRTSATHRPASQSPEFLPDAGHPVVSRPFWIAQPGPHRRPQRSRLERFPGPQRMFRVQSRAGRQAGLCPCLCDLVPPPVPRRTFDNEEPRSRGGGDDGETRTRTGPECPAASHASHASRPQDSAHVSGRTVGTTLVPPRLSAGSTVLTPDRRSTAPPSARRSLRPSAQQPEDHGAPEEPIDPLVGSTLLLLMLADLALPGSGLVRHLAAPPGGHSDTLLPAPSPWGLDREVAHTDCSMR